MVGNHTHKNCDFWKGLLLSLPHYLENALLLTNANRNSASTKGGTTELRSGLEQQQVEFNDYQNAYDLTLACIDQPICVCIFVSRTEMKGFNTQKCQ
jgi:hypothetical protein